MSLKELFIDILESYPQQLAIDNKASNPYFTELKEKIKKIFEPLVKEFEMKVKPLGGQALMRKTPYISFISPGHKTSKGIYPIYFFDSDSQLVSLRIGDADDNEPNLDLAMKFAERACELLQDFKLRNNDGYPLKEYLRSELKEDILESDLKSVLRTHNQCLNEFKAEIEEYLNDGNEPDDIPDIEDKEEITSSLNEEQIQEVILRFFKWYENDRHKESEYVEEYEKFSKEFFMSLNDLQFIDVMVRFVKEGGKIQSGGERTVGRFQKSIEGNLKEFREKILEIFDLNFDLKKWWEDLEVYTGFGKGIRSIFLNRLFPDKYAVFNNKSRNGFKLLGLLEERKPSKAFEYQLIIDAAKKLVQMQPEKLNFYRADAMTHFLLGTEEGKKVINEFSSTSKEIIWKIMAGRGGSEWNNWKENEIISVGWYKLGNLTNYKSREEIVFALKKNYEYDTNAWNDSHSLDYFCNELKIGDKVVAVKGQKTILDIGMINSDYIFNESAGNHPNQRNIIWKNIEQRDLENDVLFDVKSVTPLYPNQEQYKSVINLFVDKIKESEDFPMKEIPNIFLRNPNLIFYGPPGTGKTYKAIQTLKEIIGEDYMRESKRKYWNFITFHQSYTYEQFIEGITAKTENGEIKYIVKDGIFKSIVKKATTNPNNYYVLIIDEINRGNISKIFGELITLIEMDKRIDGQNEIKVQLPYSNDSFGVPKNLIIIGTMNTADRSIALLDVALRRRFAFIEIMPDYNVTHWENNCKVEDLDLIKLLKKLNSRIYHLYDREHQIGHSYFMKINNLDGLKYTWFNEIIPLLQEYFYNDDEKLQEVLGTDFFMKSEFKESEKYEIKYTYKNINDEDFIKFLNNIIND